VRANDEGGAEDGADLEGRKGGREGGYVGAHGTEEVEGRDADGMSPNKEGGANPKGRKGKEN